MPLLDGKSALQWKDGENCWWTKLYIYICIYMAMLDLHCCTAFFSFSFSSCGKQRALIIALLRLLILVASLVAQHRL